MVYSTAINLNDGEPLKTNASHGTCTKFNFTVSLIQFVIISGRHCKSTDSIIKRYDNRNTSLKKSSKFVLIVEGCLVRKKGPSI